MKCSKCGTDMNYYKGITEDSDYVECPNCGIRVYVNEKTW